MAKCLSADLLNATRLGAQAAAKTSGEMCQGFFFFLLWSADTFTRNEISTGIWNCDSGLNRLHEKVENLVGHAKSLANDVFNCVIKFSCRVIIYCITAEKMEGSYHVLRDRPGHPPMLGPRAQPLSDIYQLHQQRGKKKGTTTCKNNNSYLNRSSCISHNTRCVKWAGEQFPRVAIYRAMTPGDAQTSSVGHQKWDSVQEQEEILNNTMQTVCWKSWWQNLGPWHPGPCSLGWTGLVLQPSAWQPGSLLAHRQGGLEPWAHHLCVFSC